MPRYLRSYYREHLQTSPLWRRNQLQAEDIPELRHIEVLVSVDQQEEMLVSSASNEFVSKSTRWGPLYLLDYYFPDLTNHCPLHGEFSRELLELSVTNYVLSLDRVDVSLRKCRSCDRTILMTAPTRMGVRPAQKVSLVTCSGVRG